MAVTNDWVLRIVNPMIDGLLVVVGWLCRFRKYQVVATDWRSASIINGHPIYDETIQLRNEDAIETTKRYLGDRLVECRYRILRKQDSN